MGSKKDQAVVSQDLEEGEPVTAVVEEEDDEDDAPLDPLEAEAAADFYAAVEELPEELEEASAATVEFSADSLQLFLKDVGRVSLLTAAQEVELAKRIERGDHRA